MSRFYKFPINIININLLHTHFNGHETTCADIIFFYSLDIFIQIERFYKPLYLRRTRVPGTFASISKLVRQKHRAKGKKNHAINSRSFHSVLLDGIRWIGNGRGKKIRNAFSIIVRFTGRDRRNSRRTATKGCVGFVSWQRVASMAALILQCKTFQRSQKGGDPDGRFLRPGTKRYWWLRGFDGILLDSGSLCDVFGNAFRCRRRGLSALY